MELRFKSWFIILSILISTNLFAQDSSLTNSDSINNSSFTAYNLRLQQLEQQRIEDSIRRESLLNELNTVKAGDKLQRVSLEQELNEIKTRDAQRVIEKKQRIDSLRATAIGYPVNGFFNDTLFLIYSRLGSFSAKDRAEIISKRIKMLAENLSPERDTIITMPMESGIDLISGEQIVMTVSETDALWNDKTVDALAREYAAKISTAVNNYRSETNIITLAKEIGLALLVLLVIVLLIFYIGKLFKWTAIKIRKQENKLIKGIKIKDYTVFDANKAVNLFLKINTIVKWVFILLAIYITLPILFGIFPWTKHFADQLFGYILNPVKRILLSVWHYLPNLITIIVVVIVFRYILKGVCFLKNEIENGNFIINGFYPDWANPTYQIIRVLIFAFMIVVIFPYLPGSDSPIFKGVSVFLGFLFTFGSAGSLSNIVAGLVLTYMRLFKVGDRVKIGDVTGDIIEKSLLVTRIRTIKNEIVSIPNTTVMSSHTINYTSEAAEKGLILHTTVTIGYDVPWKKVHEALLLAASRTQLLKDEPKPFVFQTALEDFYVAYQINAYTNNPEKQALIYSELHQHIQDTFNEAGIEILSPHYRAQRDGNSTTTPANYLPENYQAPSFNVKIDNNKSDLR